MSEVSGGPGWWQASDGKWYRPEQHPGYRPPPPAAGQEQPGSFPSGYPTGYPQPGGAYWQPVGPPSYGTNGLAIASLILGIIWLWGLGSTLALIFGYMARRQIRDTGKRQGGDGMAIAGIVLGWIGVVGAILLIVVIVAVGTSTHNQFNPTGITP